MNVFSHPKEIASLTGYEFETICRQNTFYSYMGNYTALCRVLGKYKMYVDTSDTGVVPHLITDGYWETWLTQCLAQIVQPGSICLDIGANFGYFSLLMSELSGKDGKTIAIEPNPHVCKMLRHTEGLHSSRFEIAEMAMSDKNGHAILHVPEHNPGDASITRRKDKKAARSTKIKVFTMTVDDLVKKLELRKVDVIKMDVEGVEPLVFNGMQQTIANNPGLQIILEYSPFLYQDARYFTEYLFKNFTVRRIKDVERVQILVEADIEKLLELTDHTDLYLTRS